MPCRARCVLCSLSAPTHEIQITCYAMHAVKQFNSRGYVRGIEAHGSYKAQSRPTSCCKTVEPPGGGVNIPANRRDWALGYWETRDGIIIAA